jgi:hypothetical protein
MSHEALRGLHINPALRNHCAEGVPQRMNIQRPALRSGVKWGIFRTEAAQS